MTLEFFVVAAFSQNYCSSCRGPPTKKDFRKCCGRNFTEYHHEYKHTYT